MRTTLARRLCERLQKPDQDPMCCCGDAVEETRRCCLNAGLLASDCGVIAVRALRAGRTEQCEVQFVAATCSQSMGFGYALANLDRGLRRNMIKRQSDKGSTSIQRHEESFTTSLGHSAASHESDRQ